MYRRISDHPLYIATLILSILINWATIIWFILE